MATLKSKNALLLSEKSDKNSYYVDKHMSGSEGSSGVYESKRINEQTLRDLIIRNKWRGAKLTSYGDSITFRDYWQPKLVSELGLIHTNLGIGSTAMAGSSTNAFWNTTRINAIKSSDPDVITILGGANDLALDIIIGNDSEFDLAIGSKDKMNFKGAYSFLIETLLTWKPTLTILILTTTYAHLNGDSLNHTTGLKYTDFSEACKDVARYYGLAVVDLMGDMGVNKITQSTYTLDAIHHNSLGAEKISDLVRVKLLSI